MRHPWPVLALLALILGAAPAQAQDTAAVHADTGGVPFALPDSLRCALYTVALEHLSPDTARGALVVLDSTFNGIYRAAHHAYTTQRAPGPPADAALTRADYDALRAANQVRWAVPRCIVRTVPTRYVGFATLATFFQGPERATGWERFRVAFSGASGFVVLSRPYLSADGTEALLYLAAHHDWLSGHGQVLRLRREASSGTWRVIGSTRVWVS